MLVDMPVSEKLVADELRAFAVVLSHLPLEMQLDILRDATGQITKVLES